MNALYLLYLHWYIVHYYTIVVHCYSHSWLVRYFFGKSALRFVSALKYVSLSPARCHEKDEKTFISGKS